MREIRLTIAITLGVAFGLTAWTYGLKYMGGVTIQVDRRSHALDVDVRAQPEACGTKDTPCHINIDKPPPSILFNPD